RGYAYVNLRQWQNAVADLSAALQPEWAGACFPIAWGLAYLHPAQRPGFRKMRSLSIIANDESVRLHRGLAYAELGQWEQAAADLGRAGKLKPASPAVWYQYALLRLHQGDRDGYRSACAHLLDHFGHAKQLDTTEIVAWTCVLSPNAVGDPAQIVHLAEKALASEPKHSSYLNTLGAALYRAGQYAEAVQRLTESEALFEKTQKPSHTVVYTWLFRAMAHQRLGQTAQAQQWLAKAVQGIEQATPQMLKAPGANTWNRRLTLQLLRCEAEATLKKPAVPTQPSKKPE